VSTERMLESSWPAAAERVERLLFENSKIALGAGVEELVIVPDALLWYLPFELLPVGSVRNVAVDDPAAAHGEAADARKLLRDACRIRYAPTRSLAVLRFERAPAGGPLGVHAGKLFRGDKPEVGAESFGRFKSAIDRVVSLAAAAPPQQRPAGIMALMASLCDRLVILDELGGEGPIATRPLVTGLSGRGTITFGDWLAPPHKRPQLVALPGLQTAMADGLAKLPSHPGDDLFFATTDLLAAGARTAVVSRWRTGGKVSVDLIEEFVRDLADAPAAEDAAAADAPGAAAAESWQRAIDIVSAEQPDLAREPRVKQSPGDVLADAKHPFFWAGYMLVDCGGGRYADEPPAPGVPPKPPQPQPAMPAPAPQAAVPGPAARPAVPAPAPQQQAAP